MTSRDARGRDIVQAAFGGALYQQGRGFYSALELLAIVRGSILLENVERDAGAFQERVLPTSETVSYLRPSHDHARRLLVADDQVVPGVFADGETMIAVRALLRGIEAPVPGRRSTSDKWQQRHLYPYPAEAVHYDAVERRGRVSVERYQYRGAGGFAHKVLRTDPDLERLASTREALRRLLSDRDTAVGTLLRALARHDEVPAVSPGDNGFEDDVEARSLTMLTESNSTPTRWMRLLREGVQRILTRSDITEFDRIDGLVHWVPWCVGMHQLAMARGLLGHDADEATTFDAGRTKSAMRTRARRDLGAATMAIKDCLLRGAMDAGSPDLTRGSNAWWAGPRSFFTTTMFAVGALNANSGQRHFELRPQLMQVIVHALVDQPLSVDSFCSRVLGEELRIVCDPSSASHLGGTGIDGRALLTNRDHLVARLDEVGLLRSFSDSTQMVGVRE